MYIRLFHRVVALMLTVSAFIGGPFGGDDKSGFFPGDVEEYAYGDREGQNFDIVFPEGDGAAVRGLILYVHGGAWISGDKESLSDRLWAAASLGYAAASLNYRTVSLTVHVKEQLDDITAALAKIKSLAAGRGVTLNKVLFFGFSAGAHLSLLYAYSRAAEAPVAPAAVVSCSGPVDLTADGYIDGNGMAGPEAVLLLFCGLAGVYLSMEDYRAQTGGYQTWLAAIQKISPISYVSTAVPTVIAHGEKDNVVPPANARALDSALSGAGVKHDYVIYPNSGHTLAKDPVSAARVFELTARYAEAYL